ncbi:prolyl oligopeptidase family serine peptidase [Pelomonas sp. SE-A7]|uniref:prolyl oligopeptidase family serine peptidase n=1 Tax=Pelomonas sp. SE-A7 TaxID=3054953 RepID=UPI00259C74C1|nr:prolyl oligopeptidase family serine peptidase [Pelomonas sp. SE-A7]MDM4766642.1 prolyl oligopeptidase family serine peptidase [Pelomonas sp. SE-A7]
MSRPSWPVLALLSLLFIAQGAAAQDPHLWLEKLSSPEVSEWRRGENDKTVSVLETDPRFAAFQAQALAIEQASDRIPFVRRLDGGLWNFWQDATHVRGLWRVASPASYDAGGTPAWMPALDLDQLSATEQKSWTWKGAQCEGRREHRCLVSLSEGGEDAVTVREFDLRQRRFVRGGFELPRSRQTVVWESADALVLAREWQAGELSKSGYPYVVKRLPRGQPLSAAVEVFRGSPGDARLRLRSLSDAQGRRVVLIQRGLTFFEWESRLLTPSGTLKLNLPAKASVLELFDGQLIVRLDEAWSAAGAQFKAGTLVAVDLAQALTAPERLRPVLVFAPTAQQTLQGVAGTKSGLLLTLLDKVRGRANLLKRERDGRWTSHPIALPEDTTVEISEASPNSATAYLSVAGYLQPPSQWRVDGSDPARARLLRSLPARFDASRLQVQQFEVESSDGTLIPYTVVHAKDMRLDGSNATLLHAYGGFAVSKSPSYSGTLGKLWLERGGVYVVANIRGGGEFGPRWHEAGLKTKRQQVYDDFIAVGRDLIARGITSPRRLGITGGSNGGLLMGVAMTQHPELWNAVEIAVPLLDMLRYEQIAAGSLWVGEYGSVANADEREFLARISPYANLRRDRTYPQAFVWTTSKDDRVGPQHARKFAARLAEYGIPHLFYEFTEGGHSADTNLQELARSLAQEYVYFTRQLMDR